MKFKWVLLSLFLATSMSHAKSAPSLKEFTRTYQENLKILRANLPIDQQDPCQLTAPFTYLENNSFTGPLISLAEFCATQSDFSFYKISLELSKDKPSQKTVDYVQYRGRRFLVDGHHHILLALYAGEPSISARMVMQVDDSVSPEDFLLELEKRNMIYDGLFDPMDMVNDIYLNKVREIVRDTDMQNNKLILKGKSRLGQLIGAIAPVKPYYAEQRLGEILQESGFVLRNITAKKIITIFQVAKKAKDPRVKDLILLDTPVEITGRKTFEEAQDLIREKAVRHFKWACDKSLINLKSDNRR